MRNWAVAIAVAFAYLGLSFALNAWKLSWAIWFIYAVLRLWGSRKGETKKN